ncbi:Inner membrane protein YkgB [compost metagenome]
MPTSVDSSASTTCSSHHQKLLILGKNIAVLGVVMPMLMIGLLKFTAIEVEALKPLISQTPWLAWLYAVFGEAGTSYLLGVVEILAAVLLIASRWSTRAAVAGGALCTLTFITTLSTLLTMPIWEEASGGFPWLNGYGSFLIKDLALLGVSLMVLAEGLLRHHERA